MGDADTDDDDDDDEDDDADNVCLPSRRRLSSNGTTDVY
jgi:hypothetical protein